MMIKIKTYLSLFFISMNLLGFGQFEPGRLISRPASLDVNDITIADLDGDGLNDVIVGSGTNGVGGMAGYEKLSWYRNEGNNLYGDQQLLSTDKYTCNKVAASDLDGDGDVDILFADYDIGLGVPGPVVTNAEISWVENNGNGVFGQRNSILQRESVISFFLNDIDNDGFEDIIISDFTSDTQLNSHFAGYMLNNTSGGFLTLVSTVNNITQTIFSASDIDGDNLMDLVIGDQSVFNDTIYWAKNMSSFFLPSSSLLTATDHPFHISTTDLNGDLKTDIVYVLAGNRVCYRMNLGDGMWSAEILLKEGFINIRAILCSDINLDGIIDVIVKDNSIGLSTIIMSDNLTISFIDSTDLSSSSLIALKINSVSGNPYPQIFYSDHENDFVSYFQTLNGSLGEITYLTHDCSEGRVHQIADLNSDGYLDVLLGSGWYSNSGGNNFSRRNSLDLNNRYSIVDDYNQDQLMDIIHCQQRYLYLSIRNLDGTYTNQILLDSISNYSESYTGLFLIDINNDERNSIVSQSSNKLNIYEFNSITNALEPVHQFNIQAEEGGTKIFDLNNDGFMDMVRLYSYEPANSGIVWYKNNSGIALEEVQIPLNYIYSLPNSFTIADYDLDGDNDILFIDYDIGNGYSTLSRIENLGNDNFADPIVLFDVDNEVEQMEAIDYDSDGDMDLLISSYEVRKMSILENINGIYSNAPIIIDNTPGGKDYFIIGDIDNDGDSDALAGCRFDNKVTFYENKSSHQVGANSINSNSYFSIFPNPSSGIINIAFPEMQNGILIINDIHGRVIYKNSIQAKSLKINLQNISSGIYFIQLKTSKQVLTQKLIIN